MTPARRIGSSAAWILAVAMTSAGACRSSDSTGPVGEVVETPYMLERVATGLSSPVDLTAPAGDPRSFIVEQPGRIRILTGNGLLPQPFLDITDRVRSGGERGLLGLAFPPDFSATGQFFVHYSDLDGNTTVSRFSLAGDPNRADPASEAVYLQVDQPFSNHNGGQIAFGPDGYLYVGLGDGGSAGDPLGSGQDTRSLLGSLLRLDVAGDPPYRIPRGNPFVDDPGARDEIWAYGLRNPWRFSFDNGFIFIGDVGQNRWEEINTAPEEFAGLNYGWNRLEGDMCFQTGCTVGGTILPTVAYSHAEGCSVTGGYVYRGSALPTLVGHYVYGDYCSGWIRTFRLVGREVADEMALELAVVPNLTSFGLDGAGELYVLSQNGNVYRIVPGV